MHKLERVKNSRKLHKLAILKRVLSADEQRAANCALIVRYADDKKTVGLVALVKINNTNDRAFVISPLFIEANNAAAVTMNQQAPTVNLSIGVSAKGIAKQDSGSPGLFSSGEGVFSVKNIAIGSSKPFQCQVDKECPKSDGPS